MEQVLYQLVFYDNELSYEDHREEFLIGIFSSIEKAEETVELYLYHVTGFRDYNCSYGIKEKKVFGKPLHDKVYIFWGWNENQNMDEVNIIESDCYTRKSEAKQKMINMQAIHYRTNWCIDQYTIDECLWKDGFVRM